METYGYVRVSSKDQNEDRQMDAMKEVGVPEENIYMDKISGKSFDRPSYQQLLEKLQEEDLLVVASIDRLGRNYREVQEQWRDITQNRKADILVLDMPLLDTRKDKDLLGTFVSDLVLQVLSFVAENERENIRRRQAEGIAAAKARGIRFGRPEHPLPENFSVIQERWQRKELSLEQASRACNMPKSTFYYKARGMREGKSQCESEEERSRRTAQNRLHDTDQ